MILKVDPLTAKVSLGPESAGADPGPVCFNRGGEEPTIADCDAILRRLNPDYFLGGKVKLDVAKATRVFKEKCADRLGVDLHEAAEGMIDMLEQEQQRAPPRNLQPRHSPLRIYPPILWRLGAAASRRLQPRHRLPRHPHLPVRRSIFRLWVHHRGLQAPPFGVDADRHTDRGGCGFLEETGRRISETWKELAEVAVKEMLADGHARNAIATVPFLMARYTGQLEDVEVPARIVAMSSADDMRETLAHFEAVYAKINHRVSRHGAVGITITELGLTATADKVKPDARTQIAGHVQSAVGP